MGPFEQIVEATNAERLVYNWMAVANNTRGGSGPWTIQDVIQGNRLFGVQGTRQSYEDVERSLEKFVRTGLVKLRKLPAGMIEHFWIVV